MLTIIDHHCHFEKLTTQEQRQALANYRVVGVASDYSSALQLLELQQQLPKLSICLGIHPENIAAYPQFAEIAALIEHHAPHLVGIGEIGLPYFSLQQLPCRQYAEQLQQGLALFEQFIQLAVKFDMAVNLHCVGESTWQAIAILKQYDIKRALFHWFAGGNELVKAITAQGWFISVSPEVITNLAYQTQVRMIPKERLCLESDGPWLYQGIRGLPAMMLNSAKTLGRLFDCSPCDIIQISQCNAQTLWGLT